ncbi:MAG: DUF5667 domain-containing protein [Patescibacteria group bacterium]
MNFKARYNLWKAQRDLSPDNKFKIALKAKLDSAWQKKYATQLNWYQTVWFKRAVAFTSVVIIGASLVTGSYAYTSPDVTEGTPLYPIKQEIEKVEETVQVTPEAKAKFLLKQIDKREAEAVVIKKRGQKLDSVDKQIQKVADKLQKVDKKLEKINPQNNKVLKLRTEIKNKLKNNSNFKFNEGLHRSDRQINRDNNYNN